MFKGLVIQNLYGLSDDQLEYPIEDRRSFQQFMGLRSHQRSQAKTFWQFNGAGYLAGKGQIIDASLIPAPIQRNTREENAKIKQDDIPEDRGDHRRSQKDTDARWTQKKGKSHYGYKKPHSSR